MKESRGVHLGVTATTMGGVHRWSRCTTATDLRWAPSFSAVEAVADETWPVMVVLPNGYPDWYPNAAGREIHSPSMGTVNRLALLCGRALESAAERPVGAHLRGRPLHPQALSGHRADVPSSLVGIVGRTASGMRTVGSAYRRAAASSVQMSFAARGRVAKRSAIQPIRSSIDVPRIEPWSASG